MTQSDGERCMWRRGGRGPALVEDLDETVDRVLTGWPSRPAYNRFPRIWRVHGWTPDIDVLERGNNIVVWAGLPGVNREDVDVAVEDNVLTVHGSRKEEAEAKEEDDYRMERTLGKYSRSMRVPHGIKPEDIQATFKDGVLEVIVPEPAEAQRKQVKVEVKEAWRTAASSSLGAPSWTAPQVSVCSLAFRCETVSRAHRLRRAMRAPRALKCLSQSTDRVAPCSQCGHRACAHNLAEGTSPVLPVQFFVSIVRSNTPRIYHVNSRYLHALVTRAQQDRRGTMSVCAPGTLLGRPHLGTNVLPAA